MSRRGLSVVVAALLLGACDAAPSSPPSTPAPTPAPAVPPAPAAPTPAPPVPPPPPTPPTTPTTAVDWSAIPLDRQEACMRSGGRWRMFPTTCTDRCGARRDAPCGQALTPGCDCGDDRCFASDPKGPRATCVDDR